LIPNIKRAPKHGETESISTLIASHNKCKLPQITWSILHANISNHEERKYIEARDAGTGGQEGAAAPLPFTRRGKGGKGALSI
jgi:hypothetical protein